MFPKVSVYLVARVSAWLAAEACKRATQYSRAVVTVWTCAWIRVSIPGSIPCSIYRYDLCALESFTDHIEMPDLSSVSHFPLKVIFGIHLILTTWGIQGFWCPRSAMFYNLLFFVCLLWAIHNSESDEPLQFALLINVLAIFFDVITLAIYFPGGAEKFSAAIMIINLIARCITSVYLLRIGQARGGCMSTVFGPSAAMGYGREDYEEISHPIPQNSDFAGV